MKSATGIVFFLLILFHTGVTEAACKTSAGASYNYPVCTAANGSILMSPTGGVAPYSYHWANSDSTANIYHLAAGSYTVTITDAVGCTVSRTFSLTASSRSISVNATGYSDTCNGGRGKIVLSIAGNGNAPYTYLWSNGEHTATATGLTAGTYSIQLTDSNGCSASANATLGNDGTAISINGNLTQPSCPATGGQISVTATGGTSNTYHFLWSNSATSSSISNLSAANYVVTVTGTNSCSATSSYTVNATPAAITFNGSVNQPVCSYSRGSISINPAGGTAGYSVLWSNGSNGYSISGLNTGSYTATVTDNNNCHASQAFVVDSMQPVSPSGTISPPVCTSSNGSVTLNPSGGTAPYAYSWTTGATSGSISGLAIGSYSVTVTDANHCTGTESFSLSIYYRPLTLSSAIVADTCSSGHGRASVSVTSLASVAPFTYLWATGSMINSITGLRPGAYNVSVTDANGCSSNASASVSNFIETINLSPAVVSPICTASNGSISMTPSGGHAPYNYDWSNGSASAQIQRLAPGSYNVSVSDVYGCTATKAVSVSAYMRPMSASASAAADTCTAHIGKVTATVNSGGDAPFTYIWSNSGTTNPIIGLGAHYYTVVVTDSNGCSATAGASVSDIGTPIAISGTVYQPLCYGYTGQLSISVTGGTSNVYSTLWSNGASGLSLYDLQGGNYTVTVSGTNGCASSKSFTVNAADSITLNFNVTNINCDSDAGGAITLTSITSAAYPWGATWSGPAGFSSNSLSINHLNTGTYTINLVDANRCSTQATYTITSSGFILPKYVVTNTSCAGASNGAINRQALMPYSSPVYLWSGPNGFTADTCSIKNLAAGVYNLTITEAYGCSGTSTDTVKAGLPIALTYAVQGTKCDSAIGGALTNTSITGATYPWTASWTGPYGYTSNSVSINRLTGGHYNLSFTDALGCKATGTYTVDSTGGVNVSYGVSNIYCSENNGSITYQSLTPYSNNATYNWAGSNGFTSTGKSISGLTAGNYSVTVAESFGCQAIRNFTLTNTFDVGVASIKYINCPAPGQQIIIHPIAGDMSQLNGQHCAAGINGQVQLIVSGQVQYQGVTAGGLAPATVHGDTITWNIANFGTLNIDSSFFVVFKTDTNAVVGNNVCINVAVTPLAGDDNPSNNSSSTCIAVIRPYDPNEKQVTPDGNIDANQKSLSYTVLFQNTGNATAQNVVVLDTLDGNLDPATLQVTASSAPVKPTITGNAVKFNFEGINLPDSATDASGSKGWVQYTASIRDNLTPGSVIKNTAYIYFDFNTPIVTNTTANYFTPANSTAVNNALANETMLSLSPNPSHNLVHLTVDKESVGGRLEIIDAVGRKCSSGSILSSSFDIQLAGFASGMYLVNVVKPSGIVGTTRLIVE